MPGAALLPLGQTNHRRPVVALDQHEGQIEAGRQHRGDQKHRQIPQPDTRRHRQEAQQHDRLMHQLGLAHRLGDLVPCVQRRVEQRRFIGGHVVLPSPHPQQIVQFGLKGPLTEPGMLHVRAVAHAAVVAPAHQQPHDKMIGDRAAGDPHRQEQPISNRAYSASMTGVSSRLTAAIHFITRGIKTLPSRPEPDPSVPF